MPFCYPVNSHILYSLSLSLCLSAANNVNTCTRRQVKLSDCNLTACSEEIYEYILTKFRGRPNKLQFSISCPSICLSVPYGLLSRKTKDVVEKKIGANVPQCVSFQLRR